MNNLSNFNHPIAEMINAGEPVRADFFKDRPAEFSRFVLTYGRGYTATKLPDSIRRRKPGTCFESCANFVIEPRNKASGFRYVEGVAMRPSIGMLISHAWLTRDGEAFDITWKDFKGGDNLDCLYFGVEFSARAVGKIILKRGYYGLLDPADDFVVSALTEGSERNAA